VLIYWITLKFGAPPNLFSVITSFFGTFNFINTMSNLLKEGKENHMEKNKIWAKTGVAMQVLIVTALYL